MLPWRFFSVGWPSTGTVKSTVAQIPCFHLHCVHLYNHTGFLAGLAGKMADQNFAANICLQSAIAQHTTQEADGTEPVPRSTSPALSTASDQPGSDQTPAEGGTSYVIDTSHCVSLSPRDLTSTKNCSATSDSVHDANVHPVLPQAQSRPSSVHPLDHAFFTQQSRIVTLPRFQLPLELVTATSHRNT